MHAVLEEVDPLLLRPVPASSHPMAAVRGWRTCALCHQSILDDRMRKARLWYHDHAERLDVCEYCLEQYLREPC